MNSVKIYTRTGDDGNTGLQGGLRISKAHQRIAAYGTVDEANAALGVAICHIGEDNRDITSILKNVQKDLFVVGADLSNPYLNDLRNRVTPKMTELLEDVIDTCDSKLPPLTSFIMPSGGRTATHLHLARTIVRRAESAVVRLAESDEINMHCMIYLNRLADLLFVLARTLNYREGRAEDPWHPTKTDDRPSPV